MKNRNGLDILWRCPFLALCLPLGGACSLCGAHHGGFRPAGQGLNRGKGSNSAPNDNTPSRSFLSIRRKKDKMPTQVHKKGKNISSLPPSYLLSFISYLKVLRRVADQRILQKGSAPLSLISYLLSLILIQDGRFEHAERPF